MRQIHDTEFPNSVEATEQLLIEQGSDYAKLKVKTKFCSSLLEVKLKIFFDGFRMKFCLLVDKGKNFWRRLERRQKCVLTGLATSAQ